MSTGPRWIGRWRTTCRAADGVWGSEPASRDAPKGRKAQDGPIDPKYPLKETPSAAYLQRTKWNVRDSDATVLFSIEPALTSGSSTTVGFARKDEKPNLHLCARDKGASDKLKAFIQEHDVKVLNVAGPRASEEPGVGDFVIRTLGALA